LLVSAFSISVIAVRLPAALKYYVIPTVLTSAIVCTAVLLTVERRSPPPVPPDLTEEPHDVDNFNGPCLVLVIERDGVYIGQQRFPFEYSGDAAGAILRKENIHRALIVGTTSSRFGDAVTVYRSLDRVIGSKAHLETFPVRPGTRWNPVETLR
jgi:hypothetical protein